MVKKNQHQGNVELSKLEAKASSLKTTLGVHREQLDSLLMKVKADLKISNPTVDAIDSELKKIAQELSELQKRRKAANEEALQLMEKMG